MKVVGILALVAIPITAFLLMKPYNYGEVKAISCYSTQGQLLIDAQDVLGTHKIEVKVSNEYIEISINNSVRYIPRKDSVCTITKKDKE